MSIGVLTFADEEIIRKAHDRAYREEISRPDSPYGKVVRQHVDAMSSVAAEIEPKIVQGLLRSYEEVIGQINTSLDGRLKDLKQVLEELRAAVEELLVSGPSDPELLRTLEEYQELLREGADLDQQRDYLVRMVECLDRMSRIAGRAF